MGKVNTTHEDMTTEALATLVESIAGADPMRCNRSRPVVEARVLLVQCLRAQGYTQQRIADELGFKRETIQHYCVLWKDAEQYNNIPGLMGKWDKLKFILDL